MDNQIIEEKVYFNRELSWLEFNYRVLEEALDTTNPLFERLKFISIFASNLDEFFMVRISGLVSQVKSGYSIKLPSGDTPLTIINRLKERISELVQLQYDCFNNDILPKLHDEGFSFYTANDIPEQHIDYLKELFLNKLFLVLTPMAVDPSHPFPFLSGKELNLLVKLKDPKKEIPLFAIIPLPSKNRFIPIPGDDTGKKYILIEEFIKLFASYFFNGFEILKTCTFRITRDAEIALDEEDSNLLTAVEMGLKLRERGYPIRLELEKNADEELSNFLYENINFYSGFDFRINGTLNLGSFMDISLMSGFNHLKNEPLLPLAHIGFKDTKIDIFSKIKQNDLLLFHPFESFDPIIDFIEASAADPKVLAIKMTLYRTSGDSPIIAALKQAAENGKQVTVIVEVKARFDEARNITWAKQLEQAGCHVVYGVVGLKIHCKIALIVRDEEDGIKRYIHLSTGNYNDRTAKIYTDIGLFTAKKSYGRDGSSVFNLLTGYSEPPRWKKLITAPLDLRDFFIEKIRREKENTIKGGTGKIFAKMNALIDITLIQELYQASKAGVKIDLIVRGMCRLRPGVKEMSENIRVFSIVDQLLEHSRIYYFYNSGEDEYFLASADWMERNLDKRVELLFPVEDEELKIELKNVIKIMLKDNVKSRELQSNGNYIKKDIISGQPSHRSQIELYSYFKNRNFNNKEHKRQLFIPNLKPE